MSLVSRPEYYALSTIILICLAMDGQASETNIKINVGSLNLSLRTAPGPISISVSGPAAISSSVITYQTGSITFTCSEAAPGAAHSIPYPQQAAPGAASSISADEAAGSSKPVSASPDDKCSCVAGLPYYTNPGPEEIPMGVLHSGIALPRATIGLTDMSGVERVRLAYEAGRQAAKALQGGTENPSLFRIADRSPVVYVVLKGQRSAVSYPLTVQTFTEYKKHMFLDCDRHRPQVFAPGTVGRAFYSLIEANAYAIGVGLCELP